MLVARELARVAGLNPDTDVNIVVAGEGAQTAAMVRGGQVDALSQFDTQYAMIENAGVKLRLLDTRAIDRFPSNGFLALEETLRSRRKEAVALARSYAKGTVFAIANPEAAIRILWEVYPATKPTGKDEATALRDDTKVLQARAQNWRLEKAGVRRWGENSEANYGAYADFMLKTGIIKQAVTVPELDHQRADRRDQPLRPGEDRRRGARLPGRRMSPQAATGRHRPEAVRQIPWQRYPREPAGRRPSDQLGPPPGAARRPTRRGGSSRRPSSSTSTSTSAPRWRRTSSGRSPTTTGSSCP